MCLLLQLCNSDLRSCSIERHCCTQAPRWVQCQHGIHQVAKLKWDVLADISAVVATAKTAIVWIAQRMTPTILDGRTQSNEHLLEQLALEGGQPRQITCQQRVHHTGNLPNVAWHSEWPTKQNFGCAKAERGHLQSFGYSLPC